MVQLWIIQRFYFERRSIPGKPKGYKKIVEGLFRKPRTKSLRLKSIVSSQG